MDQNRTASIANLGAAPAYWAKMRPLERALVCEGVTLDWARTEELSNALAATLQDMGVCAGDRVGLLLPNCIEWPICFMAILRLGAIVVTLNARFGSYELEQIESDAECSVLIWQPELCEVFKDRFNIGSHSDQTIVVSPRRHAAAVAPRSYDTAISNRRFVEPAAVTGDTVFGISYTSGTTGVPKGVTLTHGCVQAGIFSLTCALRLTSADSGLVVTPLAYAGPCLLNLSPHLMLGGCVFIERNVDPERMLEIVHLERVTTLGCVPTVWQRLADVKNFLSSNISCVRVAFVGGAPVPASLSRIYRERGVAIRQVYGFSEFSGMAACPSDVVALQRPEVVGIPVLGAVMRIVDGAGKDCDVDEVGEIWLKGPQLMAGYWRNQEANAACFEDGWYKTGDLGKRDGDGQLSIIERKKNMIISGGVNIYPAEVERALSTIKGIEEVAVFGVEDGEWGEKVIAIIYSAIELQADQVRIQAKELLGPLKTPREILVTPEPLPKTNLAKISRQSLPQLYTTLTGKSVIAVKTSVADVA